MSDTDLRQVERSLQAEPASTELLRQLARLLQRAGQELRALSALDLAWRLGADELWDELQVLLMARRRTLGATALAWIPGGPFVVGADDLDEDVAPARLADLPGFWIAAAPLRWGALEGWSDFPAWVAVNLQNPTTREWAERFRQGIFTCELRRARAVIEHLNEAHPPPDGGRWALPSEEQWERAMRASYLRQDGRSPYGVLEGERCEWTADVYAPGAASPISPRKRRAGPVAEPQHVVRGVPGLPPPHRAIYREAADVDGRFEVPTSSQRRLMTEEGIALRPVVVPAP